jgi:hypothetical protein
MRPSGFAAALRARGFHRVGGRIASADCPGISWRPVMAPSGRIDFERTIRKVVRERRRELLRRTVDQHGMRGTVRALVLSREGTAPADGPNASRSPPRCCAVPPSARRCGGDPLAKRKKRSASASPADADFVRAVGESILACVGDAPTANDPTSSLSPSDKLEARDVFAGLMGIIIALKEQEIRIAREKPVDRLAAMANVHACSLIDSLLSGTSHPIWRYVLNVGSVNSGPGRRPPSFREYLRRNFIVALVLAVVEAAKREGKKVSRPAATEELRRVYDDATISAAAVKDWIRNGMVPDAHEMALMLVDQAEKIDDDRSLWERVILENRVSFELFGKASTSNPMLKG